MTERILAVRAGEYLEHVGSKRFAALPREEIERLHEAWSCTRWGATR